jgi:hypothetical protein
MFVCCKCCVLSGRGLCDELITRPEESFRLWCVVVCDLETSRMRRPWPVLGRSDTANKKHYLIYVGRYTSVSILIDIIYSSHTLLGAFAKLRKATNSFVMSVHLSVRLPVCPHGTIWLPLDKFSSNLIFGNFSKICPGISNCIKIGQE